MILHTSTPTEIIQELEKDLQWIHAEAKKKAKKLKLKIIASGITNKETVNEYTMTSPLNNRWYVTKNHIPGKQCLLGDRQQPGSHGTDFHH